MQFGAASSSGSEATAAVNLPVSLSAASGKTVTVNYSVTGGTAANGTDYTISGTSLTFNPGETSKNVPITVTNDTTSEGDETIIVGLNTPTNATLGHHHQPHLHDPGQRHPGRAVQHHQQQCS